MARGGLWKTQGKTPHATVAAQLYTDIKKHGVDSDFVQVAPNTLALRDGAAVPPKTPSNNDTKAVGKYSFTDAAEKVLEKFGNKNRRIEAERPKIAKLLRDHAASSDRGEDDAADADR